MCYCKNKLKMLQDYRELISRLQTRLEGCEAQLENYRKSCMCLHLRDPMYDD